ncbi:MAG: type II toxin-antitoxin system Phd/YefM family antitoxin [Defluviitaleaceae bacterium]|nr:type II toxin-antitoxin system Phd/YefM family antitoxin [Defluviitaleaceae bacterium]
MQNIIPISDMRFYNESLSKVAVGSEVVLTKNGKAKYTVVDFEEWEQTKATLELLKEIQKGVNSFKNKPTHTIEDFEKKYGLSE